MEWRDWVARHREDFFKFVKHYDKWNTLTPMDEEDLVGDAIVKMLHYEPTLTGRFEYAKLTVRSVVMDHFKKSNRESMCELDESMEPVQESVHQEVVFEDSLTHLKHALMKGDLHQIYILVYEAGIPQKEVSHILGVSLSTVEKRVSRIKQIVEEVL